MAFQGASYFDDQNNLLISTRLNNSNNELINSKIGIYVNIITCIHIYVIYIFIYIFIYLGMA